MKSIETSPSAHVLKKSHPEEFDLVILGGGTGSTVAAWTFAGEGKRGAVVDRKYIGGSCPNIACLPSKNIIHTAKVVDYFRRSKEFGIAHDGFTIEMSGVRDRKRTSRGYRFIANTNASRRIESLAVLLLENLSHDPEQEYFAEGL